MQNAGVEFVPVGQGVEFGGAHKKVGNRFGEAETGTQGAMRMPSVRRAAAATEFISGDTNGTRADPEDPELSEKIPPIHETEWRYYWRKYNSGDREVSQ